MNKNILVASGVLIGTIIGVGIFGLPFVIMKGGFFVSLFWFLVLVISLGLLYLLYSEIVLATREKHRLVGYVNLYLGRKFKFLAALVNIFNFWGAQLAYILIGGGFLYLLLKGFLPFEKFYFQFFVFLVMSFLIFFGIKTLKNLDFFLSFILVILIFSFFGFNFQKIHLENILIPTQNFFLPYGPILFALGGLSAIPELKDILQGKRKDFWKAIWLSQFFSALTIFLFIITVLGILGYRVTPDTFTGLKDFLNDGILLKLGLLIGILAILTSYLVIGVNLTHVFQFDFNIPHLFSWLLATFPPFLFFWLGWQNFIQVIDFVGRIFGSLEGILVCIVFLKLFSMRRVYFKSKIWVGIGIILIILFSLGLFSILQKGV